MVRLLTPNRSARADVEVQRRLTDSPRGTLTKAAIVGALVQVRLGGARPGLAAGQRPHPVIGFSEVILIEQTLADYADTLAYLGAAIRLYRDTFRRLGLLGGQGQGEEQGGHEGDGHQPTGKTGERYKVACGCQPPRSFWIRAKQYIPGPITCGVCG